MSGRRQPAPATPLTPQPKPAITLEEWEARAPLGDVEARSVNLLKEASEKAALPVKVRTSVWSVVPQPAVPAASPSTSCSAGADGPGPRRNLQMSSLVSLSPGRPRDPRRPRYAPGSPQHRGRARLSSRARPAPMRAARCIPSTPYRPRSSSTTGSRL